MGWGSSHVDSEADACPKQAQVVQNNQACGGGVRDTEKTGVAHAPRQCLLLCIGASPSGPEPQPLTHHSARRPLSRSAIGGCPRGSGSWARPETDLTGRRARGCQLQQGHVPALRCIPFEGRVPGDTTATEAESRALLYRTDSPSRTVRPCGFTELFRKQEGNDGL